MNLRKMYSVHFKKDLKMCLVNVKKRETANKISLK